MQAVILIEAEQLEVSVKEITSLHSQRYFSTSAPKTLMFDYEKLLGRKKEALFYSFFLNSASSADTE